jgi:hypothetical protein
MCGESGGATGPERFGVSTELPARKEYHALEVCRPILGREIPSSFLAASEVFDGMRTWWD